MGSLRRLVPVLARTHPAFHRTSGHPTTEPVELGNGEDDVVDTSLSGGDPPLRPLDGVDLDRESFRAFAGTFLLALSQLWKDPAAQDVARAFERALEAPSASAARSREGTPHEGEARSSSGMTLRVEPSELRVFSQRIRQTVDEMHSQLQTLMLSTGLSWQGPSAAEFRRKSSELIAGVDVHLAGMMELAATLDRASKMLEGSTAAIFFERPEPPDADEN